MLGMESVGPHDPHGGAAGFRALHAGERPVELLLINSEYKVASDEVDQQIDQLNAILKKYDEGRNAHR